MRFSKYYQPTHRGGRRKASTTTIAKRQTEAFACFESAASGTFDGFEMVDAFHRHYNKADALEILFADDSADVTTSTGATIHTGADGDAVYIMTEAARTGNEQKIVRFNHSVYVF